MGVVPVVVAVAVLTATTLAVVAGMRLEQPWLQPWAMVRAVLQLGLLSVVLAGIVRQVSLVVAFLAVMVIAATSVVLRRLSLPVRTAPSIAAVLALSAVVPVTIVFASGAVRFEPRYLLAVSGIVIGLAMTAATLMGRTLSQALLDSRDEIEGWLAIGAPPRVAALGVVRRSASTALIPATDQTRTAGIVTLPGAFVGAIFAGASPMAAAQFQLLVLAASMCAGALVVLGMALLFGAPKHLAAEVAR